MAEQDTPGSSAGAQPGSAEADAKRGADDELTRKQFLTKMTLGVGALVGGVITLPIAGMALAPAVKGRKWKPVEVGKVDDFEVGKYTKVVFNPGQVDEGPEAYVSERVAFVRRNEPGFTDSLTGEEAEFTIVSNRCVHLGCPVQQSGNSFICPCHGGNYDVDGARVAGPPVRPLDRFSYDENFPGGKLLITGEYSLDNSGNKENVVYGPGQHTGGIQAPGYWLQPGRGF